MRLMLAVPALTVLALAASGCSAFDDGGGASDGELTVAAAFYPLQFVSERIAGDHAEVTNLTPPGKEPHDLELTVKETAEITDADLVVFENGLQPAVDDAVEQNSTGATVDAAEVVDLAPFTGDADEADEAIDGQYDPHFWHDPLRMAELGDAVADELADLDPDNADDYQANAADLRGDLENLDAAFTTGLTGCERDTIVVSHDAFSYLTKYGLRLAPIAGLSPDAEPTPADLGHLQDLIRTEGITTVFGERLVSPELVDQLADDMGITAAVLDPLEGLTEETSGDDYLSLMEANLEAIRGANGCG